MILAIGILITLMGFAAWFAYKDYDNYQLEKKAFRATIQASKILRSHIKDNCGAIYRDDKVLHALDFIGGMSDDC